MKPRQKQADGTLTVVVFIGIYRYCIETCFRFSVPKFENVLCTTCMPGAEACFLSCSVVVFIVRNIKVL